MKDGYFVGNFFGTNDSWVLFRKELNFFTKEQVMKLFKNFEIIEFKEIEKEAKTGLGQRKHWHLFEVIAKKIIEEKNIK